MSSPEPPLTNSAGYQTEELNSANTAERVIPIGRSTSSVIMRALPANSGMLYIGFDNNVTVTNGFPLEAGDSLSLDIDVDKQPIWMNGDTTGDEMSWLALE